MDLWGLPKNYNTFEEKSMQIFKLISTDGVWRAAPGFAGSAIIKQQKHLLARAEQQFCTYHVLQLLDPLGISNVSPVAAASPPIPDCFSKEEMLKDEKLKYE